MIWTRLTQQQQRGAQLAARGRPRADGEAPEEAVAGREVQDHDYADLQLSPDGEPQRDIDYPATNVADRHGDITPDAPSPQVNWDDVVQPERHARTQDAGEAPAPASGDPLPEGK